MSTIFQKTIKSKVTCSGIGLHSGLNVKMSLLPAKVDSGINFKRVDVDKNKSKIPASYKNVVDTKLGTTIANEFGMKISTIEHLMAAIWGCDIDNLNIEVDGSEIPIMDGSSEPFVFLIECAGIDIQNKARKIIKITKEISVKDEDKTIIVKPAENFSIDLNINFDSTQIKKQKYSFHPNHTSFKNDLCCARTFGFQDEIQMLRDVGLAKGGSLDNAIIVGKDNILNKEGLRYNDEFVRHKLLDFIGDLYLAGHYIVGKFKAFKSGHSINNKMLHQIFSDDSFWKVV